MIDIKEYFIKRLKDIGYTVKYNVCGASTIMNGKDIWIEDWYFGFWADMQNEGSNYFKVSIKKAIDNFVDKANTLCKKKVIAIGECGIDKTFHADYQDHYYNVYVSFGGY